MAVIFCGMRRLLSVMGTPCQVKLPVCDPVKTASHIRKSGM
jgi:hypothetical protein